MTIQQFHPIMSWLVAYAAWMIMVPVKGPYGFTAYKRVRHKRFTKRLVPRGEVVQIYLPAKSSEKCQMGALAGHTKLGVVLGNGAQ